MVNENRATHYDLAYQYELQGKQDSAIVEYKEALKIDPDYAEAHYRLGKIYRMQGNFDLADREFEEVRRIDPKFDAQDKHGLIQQKEKAQQDKAQQNKPPSSETEGKMSLKLKWGLSLIAGIVIGGPIAVSMGTHNPSIGVIVAIIVFIALSIPFNKTGQSKK